MNGNGTTNYSHSNTHGWVPQPDGRGTLDILWSCIITIFLCCWTSVCANIPGRNDTLMERFWDKLNLACLGIIGPEFLFTLAMGQWISAQHSVEVSHTFLQTDGLRFTDRFHASGIPCWRLL
jgi:hypothetical protein